MTPRLAVAIPALEEASRLPAFLEDLVSLALQRPQPVVDFIVVDDGSSPGCARAEEAAVGSSARRLRAAGSPHSLSFLGLPRNRGKGAAVRSGWSRLPAGADWLGFLDADGSVAASEFWRLAGLLEAGAGFGALLASRRRMPGRRVERRAWRHVQGRVFAFLVEALLRLGLYDTQCGLKFFRSSLIVPRLAQLREERWLLDLEILLLCADAAARMREEPIDWADRGGSKVLFALDPCRMLLGLLRLAGRRAR